MDFTHIIFTIVLNVLPEVRLDDSSIVAIQSISGNYENSENFDFQPPASSSATISPDQVMPTSPFHQQIRTTNAKESGNQKVI